MIVPGQLRRWTTRAVLPGTLTEGDLITILEVYGDSKRGEPTAVVYLSRHGRGVTPTAIVERYTELIDTGE